MDPTTPRTALSSSGALRSKAAAGERKYRNSSNVPSIRWTITTRTIRQGGPRRKPASVAESSYDVLGTARRAQCRRRGRRRRGLRAPPPGRGRPEPSRGLRGRVRAGDRAGGAGRGPRAGSAVARLAGARALRAPAPRRRLGRDRHRLARSQRTEPEGRRGTAPWLPVRRRPRPRRGATLWPGARGRRAGRAGRSAPGDGRAGSRRGRALVLGQPELPGPTRPGRRPSRRPCPLAWIIHERTVSVAPTAGNGLSTRVAG